MRAYALRFAGSLALALAATQAFAHAQLEKSIPAVGSTVSAPSELRLDFSEGVEPKFSKVTLTGPSGAVPTGALAVEGSEKTELVVPLGKPLAPGAYKVQWRATSVDSHHTQGTFGFSVK